MTTILESVKGLKASPADYLPLSRRIEEGVFSNLLPLKVGLLSSFTTEPMKPYLVVEAARLGIGAQFLFGGYARIESMAFDNTSDLYRFGPDVIVIAWRLEEAVPRLASNICSEPEIERETVDLVRRVQELVSTIRDRSRATVLVWNFAEPSYRVTGLADATLKNSQTRAVQRANQRLAEACSELPGAFIFDAGRLAAELGLERWHEPKLYFTSRLPFGTEAQQRIARLLARYLRAICLPAKKCLVVDLDQTLWGGILGEDGPDGIALGEDYPGNVFKNFQRYLLALRSRGILLAIASKNRVEDVKEVFERHPDCVLKLEHFSSVQVGWQEKDESLRAIAAELNIGLDSLVFFDDSAFEREWVRRRLPQVQVVDPGVSPMDYIRSIEESSAFDHLAVTEEDLHRANAYLQERNRLEFKSSSASLDDFLKDLKMQATCGLVDERALPRVVQLVAKTNQLNLTTRRHTLAQIQAMTGAGGVAIWMRLKDRFGDQGLIGVGIAVPEKKGAWFVDTLLLSCRVIGRKAEEVLLSEISRLVRDRQGKTLDGEYLPTEKNAVASRVYRDSGFESLDGDGRFWRWDLSRGTVPCPEFIEVVFDGGESGRLH